jgi:hypothetical protein
MPRMWTYRKRVNMTKHEIELNNNINEMLQASLKLEQQLLKKKDPTLASLVRRTTSSLAECMIKISGLDKALHPFWMERKALAV